MKKLSKDIINEVSLEIGLPPSYIEKDWYLVKILKTIMNLNTNEIMAVFSGGTSLSKAYGYINRFSEDIDFCILGLSSSSRKYRSKYKNDLILAINDIDNLEVDVNDIFAANEDMVVSFKVRYFKYFEMESCLRDELKIDLTFKDNYLPLDRREIKSFISTYIGNSDQINIDCISYIETAANKFNALLWRTDIKDRNSEIFSIKNDPTLMRHLYDLHVLSNKLIKSDKFSFLVKEIYKYDCKRACNKTLSLNDFCNKTVQLLLEDKEYRKEYNYYVNKMVYLNQDIISFDDAFFLYHMIYNLQQILI